MKGDRRSLKLDCRITESCRKIESLQISDEVVGGLDLIERVAYVIGG